MVLARHALADGRFLREANPSQVPDDWYTLECQMGTAGTTHLLSQYKSSNNKGSHLYNHPSCSCLHAPQGMCNLNGDSDMDKQGGRTMSREREGSTLMGG